MKIRFQLIAVVVLATLISACVGANGTSEVSTVGAQEREAISALSWLDSSDPEQDALAAVANKRFELFSMGTRGGSLPGIDPESSVEVGAACGFTVLPGATDVVLGDTHLNYLQRAYDYAEVYNRIVAEHCLAA